MGYGNWFENAKKVLDRTQNLNADGDTFTGNVVGAVSGYAVDGAISTSDYMAVIKSTAATADLTLADGTTDSQRMSIVCSGYTNSCTVVANFGGAITTATFSAAGEAIDLQWVSGNGVDGWYVLGNNGVVLS